MSRITSMDVFRRAREAAQAVEESREEEIWVLPAGPVTDEQMARVLRLVARESAYDALAEIDAEGEES